MSPGCSAGDGGGAGGKQRRLLSRHPARTAQPVDRQEGCRARPAPSTAPWMAAPAAAPPAPLHPRARLVADGLGLIGSLLAWPPQGPPPKQPRPLPEACENRPREAAAWPPGKARTTKSKAHAMRSRPTAALASEADAEASTDQLRALPPSPKGDATARPKYGVAMCGSCREDAKRALRLRRALEKVGGVPPPPQTAGEEEEEEEGFSKRRSDFPLREQGVLLRAPSRSRSQSGGRGRRSRSISPPPGRRPGSCSISPPPGRRLGSCSISPPPGMRQGSCSISPPPGTVCHKEWYYTISIDYYYYYV